MSEIEEVQEQMKADMEAMKEQMATMMEAMRSMKKIMEVNAAAVAATSAVARVDPIPPSSLNQINYPTLDMVGQGGQKSDWIMHEYRLDDINNTNEMEHGWVVCRVFKKKNVPLKTLDSPKSMTMNMFTESDYCGGFTNWESLDQLVASQLNGQTETYCSDLQFPAFLSSSYIATTTTTTTHIAPTIQDYPSYDIDLWNHCASCPTLQM